MLQKQKIIILSILLICISPLSADNSSEGSVWFSENTPYLTKISSILDKNNYVLALDSLTADYLGECLIYRYKDSLKCEITVSRKNAPARVIGSFIKEQAVNKDVRKTMKSFGIWLLFLNTISAILFFVRF